MPVGDINSTERGSGARFNDGKPDLSLIPPICLPYSGDPVHLSLLSSLYNFMYLGDGYLLVNQSSPYRKLMYKHYADCANVFSYGAKKYAPHNWVKGMKWSVPIACILRHAHKLWVEGEENDPESGLPHVGHILCNLVMLDYYTQHYDDLNDLPFKVLHSAST